jgi:hypothetical protein
LEMPLNKNPARDCFLGSKTEEEWRWPLANSAKEKECK